MSEREEGRFEGKVLAELKSIKTFIKTNSMRIECVEKKQEKFAWYVGIAVGVGAAIMFVVDRVYDLIKT